MTTINFVADQKLETILDLFRSQYPAMSDVDIIRIGMGGFYRQTLEDKHKLWVASLPELDLTKAQTQELEKSINEANNNPNPQQYSDVDQMIKDILSDNQI